MCGLPANHRPLAGGAPAIPTDLSGLPNHPVTRNQERDGIAGNGAPHRALRTHPTHGARDIP